MFLQKCKIYTNYTFHHTPDFMKNSILTVDPKGIERSISVMAHLDSYPKQSIKKILKEHDRTATAYKNDVDPNRTKLNYGFGHCNLSAEDNYKLFQKRATDIMNGRDLQSHTNIMSEWVITYPSWLCTQEQYDTGRVDKNGKPIIKTYNKPIDENSCKDFFATAYAFAIDKYGKDNVMAGYVHMDETTPHLAIDLVPEAISRKTGENTVSSASLFTRKHLSQFQKELEQVMYDRFHIKGMILNGKTKGNLSTEDLKARTKQAKQLQEQEDKLQAREAELQQREKELNARTADVVNREADLNARENAYNAKLDDLRTKVENITTDSEYLINSLNKRLELCDDKDMSRKAFMQTIKYKNGKSVEDVYQERVTLAKSSLKGSISSARAVQSNIRRAIPSIGVDTPNNDNERSL